MAEPTIKSTAGKTGTRLAFIDWARGLAALVMLQGHSFHSFTRTDLRNQGPYVFSQFVGGEAPALFLFLTGITYAFLMDSQERKQASNGQKIRAALASFKNADKIKQVRGAGLMLGIALHASDAAPVVQKALSLGLVINATSKNVLRLAPALTIPTADLDEALPLLDQALTAI